VTDDLVRRLREGACLHNQLEAYDLTTEAADRIEELEAALREKDNIAYIIDGHGITHITFTIVYKDKSDD
jgi:hypothetical protein